MHIDHVCYIIERSPEGVWKQQVYRYSIHFRRPLGNFDIPQASQHHDTDTLACRDTACCGRSGERRSAPVVQVEVENPVSLTEL